MGENPRALRFIYSRKSFAGYVLKKRRLQHYNTTKPHNNNNDDDDQRKVSTDDEGHPKHVRVVSFGGGVLNNDASKEVETSLEATNVNWATEARFFNQEKLSRWRTSRQCLQLRNMIHCSSPLSDRHS